MILLSDGDDPLAFERFFIGDGGSLGDRNRSAE